MTVHYQDERVTLHHGDCLDVLATMPDASVDSIVTDPPYGLEFMAGDFDKFQTYAGGNPGMKPGKPTVGASSGATYGYRQKNPRCRRCGKLKRGNGACKCPEPQWDTRTAESAFQFQAWSEDWAREAWRVIKPGGYLLAFGGTRTWHRLAVAIEDAGFEIRDSLAWAHNQGFPRAKTQLRPGYEPVTVGRRPLSGTLADNAHRFGTGALNVDAGRAPDGRWPANIFEAPKASKRERPNVDGVTHPTVKPLTLMRWLVRLVTPPGGTVLDPFAGSGATLEAAMLEGFHSIGIEREHEYLPLTLARINRHGDELNLGGAA